MNGAQPVANPEGRCTCGMPDCSDAPYVLPVPSYRHLPEAGRVPAPRKPNECEDPAAQPEQEPEPPRVPEPRKPAEDLIGREAAELI